MTFVLAWVTPAITGPAARIGAVPQDAHVCMRIMEEDSAAVAFERLIARIHFERASFVQIVLLEYAALASRMHILIY